MSACKSEAEIKGFLPKGVAVAAQIIFTGDLDIER